jgi:hypothetical protein
MDIRKGQQPEEKDPVNSLIISPFEAAAPVVRLLWQLS